MFDVDFFERPQVESISSRKLTFVGPVVVLVLSLGEDEHGIGIDVLIRWIPGFQVLTCRIAILQVSGPLICRRKNLEPRRRFR